MLAVACINGVSSIWTEMDYRVPTFIDVLGENGYRTALFGKWHLGEQEVSEQRGFDAWKVFPGQGDYVDPEMIDQSGRSVEKGYATDIVTDLSLDGIDQRGEDEPFCLLVHHKAPHRPWVPDEKHKDLCADGTIPSRSKTRCSGSKKSGERRDRQYLPDQLEHHHLVAAAGLLQLQ